MTLAVSTVAVTGATGYVGRFVVAELQRAGLGVRALARPHSALDGFSAPPEWCIGDLRDADSLRAFAQGADAVVHLAYEHVPGRYRGGEGADLPAWLDANLYGSLRLLTAAQAAGVKRFLFLSSRAVFSRTEPGRVLDESHPTSPDTHYGAYKAAVESFLWSFAHTSGMKSCAVRATGVYGLTWPVERSKWWGVVRAVLRDEEVGGGGGGTEVHGADLARIIRLHLTTPAPVTDIVHVSDRYITQREVVRLAREISGRRGPLPPQPDAPPANPLVCKRLTEMGGELGGAAALEATVAELVRAVAATEATRRDSV